MPANGAYATVKLQKYVWSRVDGPSSRQTGDDGFSDTLVCCKYKTQIKGDDFPRMGAIY